LAITVYSGEMVKDFNTIPAKGTVTMIDLGAKKCIPCKMMAPIMEKLEKTYAGKAEIVFIDVWKNNDQANRFRINAIPTQIFFDKDGNEVYRHTGFMDENSIVQQLTKMGVPAPGTATPKDPKKKG
jgi:thioredoxin 1